jgi:hypothetical protein
MPHAWSNRRREEFSTHMQEKKRLNFMVLASGLRASWCCLTPAPRNG